MLARSAARRQQRQTERLLDACFKQLSLPWLAPAQLRFSATYASATHPSSHRPRRRSLSKPRQLPALTRHLATAADQYISHVPPQFSVQNHGNAFRNTQDSNIPWDLTQRSDPKLSDLRPYNDPIIINNSMQTPAQTIKVTHGVQGNVMDLLHHLHTAIQVGRLPRAATIIQRMAELCTGNAPELMHAHTAYLEESLRRLALHGRGEEGRKVLITMQKWFETEIVKKGVTVNAKMLVVMIRAAIRALGASKERGRTVRRYAEKARAISQDVYDEVMDSEDYDDHEFTLLGRLTSEHQKSAEHASLEQLDSPVETPKLQYQRPDALPVETLPEVLSTTQRGEGLASVKRAFEQFNQTPALPADAPLDKQRQQAFQRQKLIEETAVDVAIERWRKADEELRRIGINTSMQSKPVSALMWQWYEALLPALDTELAECRKLLNKPTISGNDRSFYAPYLELLPISKIAATTILHTVASMPQNRRKKGPSERYRFEHKLARLTVTLATAIKDECAMQPAKGKSAHQKLSNNAASKMGQKSQAKGRGKSRKIGKHDKANSAMLTKLQWPSDVMIKLGSMLISKLLETAQLPVTRRHPRTNEKITQMQPAFLHRVQYERGKKLGMLVANPALMEKFESEPLGSMLVKRMPMVVEPVPWTAWSKGGYIQYPQNILRLPKGDAGGKDHFLAAHERGDMSQIYAGLTALGEVPWKVHHGVFKVQLEAWNSGEAIAKFAPLHPQLDVPAQPESSEPSAKAKWLADMRAAENTRIGLHSQRCFQNFQLESARSMINETMWFPHNLDFRGRAYPIPPYLNHMGADTVRGLLVFANGRELGPRGLTWLKIHLATVAGHDKASLSERVNFTEEHLDDIYDSVRNPLNGRRWWLKSDDPWQTLSACFEVTQALDSPDPTKFVSHLPIQQDGTCNGLQHYAALGGDKIGAAQVNLEPGDRPADVYTAVMQAVVDEVHQDALAGNPIALKLDGNITRKCVKQPVMTNVYGVTFFGAMEQVKRQLEVIFPGLRAYDDINYAMLSHYVATKIFKSLGTMFSGAQAIQQWLGECADRISRSITPEQVAELCKPTKPASKSTKPGRGKNVLPAARHGTQVHDLDMLRELKSMFKTTVVWTTPLRLPVVQPYRIASSRHISTSLQRITLTDPQVWHPVSKQKQLQAFPPNFIHSLDATHMMLSALQCKEQGITFASIHDSFWTHACDVDRLSVALRDAFVEMHKEDIIGRLREEFLTRYKGCMHFSHFLLSTRAGQRIAEHRKQAKLSNGQELEQEMKRLRLLASEDPKEREEGEKMVTPASIVKAEGEAPAFELPREVKETQLGSIPDGTTSGSAAKVGRPAKREAAQLPEVSPVERKTLDADSEAHASAPTETTKASTGDKAREQKQKKPQHPRKIHVWLPQEFPDVPPKGEFDVRKIKDSNYFFH